MRRGSCPEADPRFRCRFPGSCRAILARYLALQTAKGGAARNAADRPGAAICRCRLRCVKSKAGRRAAKENGRRRVVFPGGVLRPNDTPRDGILRSVARRCGSQTARMTALIVAITQDVGDHNVFANQGVTKSRPVFLTNVKTWPIFTWAESTDSLSPKVVRTNPDMASNGARR